MTTDPAEPTTPGEPGVPSEPAAQATAQAPVRRRAILQGLVGLGLGAGLGVGSTLALQGGRAAADERPGAGQGTAPSAGSDTATPAPATAVDPYGPHQAGITRPGTPQVHSFATVLDLDDPTSDTNPARVLEVTAAIGEAITALLAGDRTDVLPDGPGDLTIAVGLGPRLVTALGPSLPGAEDLPVFVGDDALPAELSGGDVLLQACGASPNDVEQSLGHIVGAVPGLRVRWSQRGMRGPGEGYVVRNPLGFHDGIVVPTTADEQDENVWIPDGPAAGGTICVVRRLRLDTTRFRRETASQQESAIGRRHDGSPLSGDKLTDAVDLLAKSPDGEYIVPAPAHARAAHPSFTGSHLMLRRGYAFDNGAPAGEGAARDAGLLFICFQTDLRTFVQTQHRLDEIDDLMGYVTTTASGTFLMLPGVESGESLGAVLGSTPAG